MKEQTYVVTCGSIHRTVIAANHAKASLLAVIGYVAETGRVGDLDCLDSILSVGTADGNESWFIDSAVILAGVVAMLRPEIHASLIMFA